MASSLRLLRGPVLRSVSHLSTRSFVCTRCSSISSKPRTFHRSALVSDDISDPMSTPFPPKKEKPLANSPPVVIPAASNQTTSNEEHQRLLETSQAGAAPPPPVKERPRPKLRASKAAMTIMPEAVVRLRSLLSGPNPQYIRVGVRNKGCAGMSYHLEYVDKPGKFDERVEQDGVTVLIDSKALFSIIGSEMDWVEDKLSSKFAFKNPNIKDACGCGESFNVQPTAEQ